jgi:hypothetical protein
MHPPVWHTSLEPSPTEQATVCRIPQGIFLVFLHWVRHELFADALAAARHIGLGDRYASRREISPLSCGAKEILTERKANRSGSRE